MQSPENIYNENIQSYSLKAQEFKRKYAFWSTIRVIFFIISTIILVYLANIRDIEAFIGVLAFFPIFFGILVKFHNRIRYHKSIAENLQKINKNELQRVNGDLHSFPQGLEYNDTNHNYSNDLDVFGSNSVFQLTNRTSTIGGSDILKDWLLSHPDKETILERQKAVKELSPMIDWRQGFQAAGMLFQDEESHINALTRWLSQPDLLKNKLRYRIIMIVMACLAVGSIVLFVNGFGSYYFLGVVVINGIIIKNIFASIKETTDLTSEGYMALKAYHSMIGKVEERKFSSAYLTTLTEKFDHDNFKASAEIKKLNNILYNLENRANIFYWLLNVIFLLDVFWLLKAEHWRRRNKPYASYWFDAINHFEAINSLAGFSFANPDFVFPTIVDNDHHFKAEGMGHPLIKKHARVHNDFFIHGKGKVAIITGSNMSGKSTFLRTIGVNVVLALMGAPVCAESMEASTTRIFTGMRTQDNLEENVSSFYAELKRLRQLLDLLENKEPVLFMLDEILKGTNSHDRHRGAASLVRQLIELNACGLVSTHDLELGSLSNDLEKVENFSFNSEIKDDEIIFDYKLHHGICKSFNASKLMEKMGIKIN